MTSLRHHRLPLTLLLHLLLRISSSVASTSAASSLPRLVDVSYLSHAKPSNIVKAIQQELEDDDEDPTSTINNEPRQRHLHIDVSASLLGTCKELQTCIQSVIEKSNNLSRDTVLELTVRRNQWSPKQATDLLKAIMTNVTTSQQQIAENSTAIITEIDDLNSTRSKNSTENQTVATETVNRTVTPIVEPSPDEPTVENASTPPSTKLEFQSLDLGWNDFHPDQAGSKEFVKSLQNLLEHEACPSILKLDVCALGPSACRSIAKGLVNRWKSRIEMGKDVASISLSMARNDGIGDAGVAALSAAIRTISDKLKNRSSSIIFESLDLSGCGIGDTGAEALAIALEEYPCCIRHLDLSHNSISDEGVAAIERALSSACQNLDQSSKSKDVPIGVEILDLSFNNDIGDQGASSLAELIKTRMVQRCILRSCHVHADGAAAFGAALKSLIKRKESISHDIEIDLSGNPIGVLRKASKSSGGSKYSATALKSKASKTTAAYMSFINKRVQKGLQDFGVTSTSETLESDDEEEERMDDDGKGSSSSDASKVKCGALSFAEAYLEEDEEEESIRESSQAKASTSSPADFAIELGFRRCSLDTRAVDALAAVTQHVRSTGTTFSVDVRMNYVLEDEMVDSLKGNPDLDEYLGEMAERHLEAMEVLREAKRRAKEAAVSAAARARAEAEVEDAWGDIGDFGGGISEDWGDEEHEWDSDQDYDDQDQYDDYF